jgi:hypothetical protein
MAVAIQVAIFMSERMLDNFIGRDARSALALRLVQMLDALFQNDSSWTKLAFIFCNSHVPGRKFKIRARNCVAAWWTDEPALTVTRLANVPIPIGNCAVSPALTK